MGFFKRLFCRHPEQEFVRNIYGDEIVDWNYKRSIWKCQYCGAVIAKDELHRAAQKGGA